MLQEFPEVKIKRQIIDPYLKDICNITSYYGIFTIEITSPKPKQIKHQTQKDDIDKEFSKVFKDYVKNIQQQNSQRANSIFTNNVFSITYSYLSILELRETQGDSPTQTSRKTAVRQEICNFSKFLNTIRENLTRNEISQNVIQILSNIQTATPQINNIHDSDTDLAEKITQILNIYAKNPNFKGKPSFKKRCNYGRRYRSTKNTSMVYNWLFCP